MKIVKVSYQKAYIIGPYLQEKVGFEAETTEPYMDEDATVHIETPQEILSHLRQMADDWHKENNPQLNEWTEFVFPPGRNITPVIDQKQKDRLEIAIDNAQTPDELRAIKEECWTIGLPKEWCKKMNELCPTH